MVRRVLAILVLFALALGACRTGSESTTTTTSGTGTQGTAPASTLSPTTTAGVPSTTTTTTELDLSGLDLPADVLAQLEVLIRAAEEIRELRFIEAPNVMVVPPGELAERIRSDIEEQSEDIPADEALYKLLGLLDSEVDFEGLLLDLYGEQVAGFYDPEAGEVVVRARESVMSVAEQSTVVHELVHALTDQHFDFHTDYQAMLDEERLDQATAYQALIEGDATLAQVMWLQGLSQRELGEFVAESLDTDTTALDDAPEFLVEALLFPYDTGLGFVQALHRDGGWDAVNEAYSLLVDLPGSSEQVITPADYRRDLPITVDIPDISLAGYTLERTSVWGEAGFRIMLEQVVGSDAALVASDGWGGDAYHQWFDGTNAAFLLVFEGDTAPDVEELRESLLDFALASVPEEAFVWVDEKDGLLYFVAADDVAVGEFIRDTTGLS